MASHSSILAWRTAWTEEPGGLQSTESRVGEDLAIEHTHTHTRFIMLAIKLKQRGLGNQCHKINFISDSSTSASHFINKKIRKNDTATINISKL